MFNPTTDLSFHALGLKDHHLGLLFQALHLPPLQLQVLAEVGRHLPLLLQLTCR